MRKLSYIFLFFVFFIFTGLSLLNYFFFDQVKASDLKEGYLFLGDMEAGKQTNMTLLLTPSSDFTSPTEERILRITFPGESGDWCQANDSFLNVTGVDSSPVDIADWSIETSLPGTLSGKCYQDEGGDFIEIIGIGNLSASVKYGLQIDRTPDFLLSSSGNYTLPVQLYEGLYLESKNMIIYVSESASVSVSANILDISTITCTLSHSALSFGTLPKNGDYLTVQHTARTSARDLEGYYWAVFGQGDGVEAGLWKSTPPTSLIASSGSSTLDLSLNEGFGLTVASPYGEVRPHFRNIYPGRFGAINSGQNNTRLIFTYINPEHNPLVQTMTLGARAGIATEPGAYSEMLTYICGGFY